MEKKKYVDFDEVITTYKTFGHLNLHNALEAFNEIPAADVQLIVHGYWIWDGYVYDAPWQCSNCGVFHDVDSNFCPNCGADMRGTNE